MSYGEKKRKGNRGPLVATYTYGGALKNKYLNELGERSFNWFRWKDGQEIPLTEEDRERIGLYHADELIAADHDRALWFCEGEKDCDRLRSLGFLATTAPHGVLGKGQGWRPSYTAAVRRFDRVTVLEDNDDAGRTHVALVARELNALGIDVRVVRFPDLPEKGDVSDWLDLGHTAEELAELSEQAPRWQPGDSAEPWSDIEIPASPAYGPEFQSARLPSPFGEWVQTVARSIEVPKALPALLELAIVGAACAKKVVVRMNQTHDVPVNVWSVIALDSGERKSSTFRESMTPVSDWQARVTRSMQRDVAEYAARVDVAKKSLANAKGVAAGKEWGGPEADDVARLARDLADLESRPVVTPKFTIGDASPEATAKLVAIHGRILIASAEGIVFDQMAGKYSDKDMPNLDIYLMGYSGDDYVSERITRESVTAVRPAISMALTTQPEVIAGLGRRTGFTGRGIVPRFWYAIPAPMVGYRNGSDPQPIDPAVRARRNAAIEALLDLPMPDEPHVLTFETAALRTMLDFVGANEARLRPDGDLYELRAWGTRIPGGTARLCGILHMMTHADDLSPWNFRISEATVSDAIGIMKEFLVPHAIVAYSAMGATSETALAMNIVAALKQMGRPEVTRRDIQLRFRASKVADLAAALGLLADWNVVRDLGKRKTDGRPAGPFYAVNLALFAEEDAR